MKERTFRRLKISRGRCGNRRKKKEHSDLRKEEKQCGSLEEKKNRQKNGAFRFERGREKKMDFKWEAMQKKETEQ